MGQSIDAPIVQGPGIARPAEAPTALIVSDVLLYREGLRASLARAGLVRVLDSVAATDALAAISRCQPDVVLLDGAVANCLQLARQVHALLPRLKLVGFAISGGADRMVDCAESGLTAFVDCDGSVEELVDAILGALHGELTCSPRVTALMCERLARLSAGSRASLVLTQREREISALVSQGLSNKEIAIQLNIGVSTVKNHVHSILEKLNVRRRSAIAQRVIDFSWMREAAHAAEVRPATPHLPSS